MKNPVLIYALARLGLFAVAFAIFFGFTTDPFLAAIVAAGVSLLASIVLLRKQRAAMGEAVANRISRNDKHGADDADSDLENELLDGQNDTEGK
jgi:hypothetical protein